MITLDHAYAVWLIIGVMVVFSMVTEIDLKLSIAAILPMLLSAAGWQFPAKFYFRKLVVPLAERRRQRKLGATSGA